FWIVELALAAAGVWVVRAQTFRVGGYVISRPHTIYVGIILILQFPIGALSGVAIGAAEGIKAQAAGSSPDLKRIQKKYAYLDLAIAGGALALAFVVGASAMREDLPQYVPREAVAGIRDIAAEQEQREAAKKRAEDEWRGESVPTDWW